MEKMLFKPKKNVECEKIDNCTVILQPDELKIYRLNETATFIWESVRRKISFDSIVKKITAHFDIDEKKARKTLEAFITELHKKKLIEKIKR